MRLYPTKWFPLKGDGAYFEEEQHLYVMVYVFAEKEDMRRYWNLCDRGSKHDFEARYCALVRRVYDRNGKRERTLGEFAEVTFWKGALTTEIVTHEFTHVALAYARRRKIAMTPDADTENDPGWMQREEVVCYAVGSLVRQFVNRAHALGLYDSIR
ncbi:MAG TPA: hypothetical protein VII66_13105 [Gemmatimonadaceae bacterium]